MRAHIDYPQIPFHALLQRAAVQWPDETAIVFGERRMSYGEWDRRANQFAHALDGLRFRRGDRMALYMPNCPEYEVAFFGCARLGVVPVPVNPSYKERELRHQMDDSGAAGLVVHASLYPTVSGIRSELPELRDVIVVGEAISEEGISFDALLAGRPDTAPEVDLQGEDLAALPYSSGTVGLPKGVMLTQRNLVCNAVQYVDATDTTSRDTILIFLPLYHIYGVALVATAIAAGARQILMERFDLSEVIRLVEEEGVTELYVVPPVMLALLNSADLRPEQFKTLRFMMSAAAPLSTEVARRLAERLKVPVIQAYGMTETSPLTHMVPLERAYEVLGSVGVVVADTQCRIVDIETGAQVLPPGEIGEVTASGPQVMKGYWNAPQETANTLRGSWIHTGDIGSVDGQGNLYLVDRKKEMIKYKGFGIAPAELESVLLEHPAVLDCAVTAQPDDEAGEVPRAYVVLRPGQDFQPDELLEFVRVRVATYKQIRAVEQADAIPRTPSGKILRRVLKERARVLS